MVQITLKIEKVSKIEIAEQKDLPGENFNFLDFEISINDFEFYDILFYQSLLPGRALPNFSSRVGGNRHFWESKTIFQKKKHNFFKYDNVYYFEISGGKYPICFPSADIFDIYQTLEKINFPTMGRVYASR